MKPLHEVVTPGVACDVWYKDAKYRWDGKDLLDNGIPAYFPVSTVLGPHWSRRKEIKWIELRPFLWVSSDDKFVIVNEGGNNIPFLSLNTDQEDSEWHYTLDEAKERCEEQLTW